MSLDQQYLKSRLEYCPDSGDFYWLPKKEKNGYDARWNRDFAGELAGSEVRGRRAINIDGTPRASSRLAWLYTHGEWPEEQIDHKNRDSLDDRICNLRKATPQQNNSNKAVRSDSSSGIKGIWFHKETGKWRASIRTHGKARSLGLFFSPQEAGAAYNAESRRLHGEFTYCGEQS